ncbi:MAG: hypothetical protein H6R18_818 [Proteobacteria bacterium]|nr:hypothetical protein [Pseudomonadota bacterium]
MAQEPIDLAEYRKRREKQAAVSWRVRLFGGSEPSLGPGEVHCTKCRQPISRRASQCPHCGVHFSGSAADFAPQQYFLGKTWVKWVFLLLILSLILAAFQGWAGI